MDDSCYAKSNLSASKCNPISNAGCGETGVCQARFDDDGFDSFKCAEQNKGVALCQPCGKGSECQPGFGCFVKE